MPATKGKPISLFNKGCSQGMGMNPELHGNKLNFQQLVIVRDRALDLITQVL